nr:MAG TPA: hypothetical protein [Caudoviricetes sp.]
MLLTSLLYCTIISSIYLLRFYRFRPLIILKISF